MKIIGEFFEKRRTELWLLAALCAVFALLEAKFPFYFLQDDSFNCFLPMFDYNFTTLLSGHIPFYNPHQYLGMPMLSAGQYASLYPPVYLSVGLSRLLWGHCFAALDILMFLHLACGLLGFFTLMRLLGLGKEASAFGALAWMLNGAAIFLGSSWCSVGPTVAYFPWMLYSVTVLLRRKSLGAFMALLAWRLLYLYSGYVQLFLYAALFEALAVGLFLYSRRKEGGVLAAVRLYVSGWATTILLGLPILSPMWLHAKMSGVRSMPLPYEQFSALAARPFLWLWGLFWPFGAPPATLAPVNANYYELFVVYFSHIGFAPLMLLLAWPWLKAGEPLRRLRLLSLLLAAIALLWAWGALSPLLYQLPVFNRFRYPMKLLLFANFFLIVVAAVNLHVRIISPGRFTARHYSALAFFVLLLGAGLVYGAAPRRNFYINLDTVPLHEPRKDALKEGRVLSLGVHDNKGDGYSAHLAGYNFASLLGLQHFAGYDPMVLRDTALRTGWLNYSSIIGLRAEGVSSQVKYWRSWGVRWYMVNAREAGEYGQWLLSAGLTQSAVDSHRVVFEDKLARPMAYLADENGPVGPLEHRITPAGIEMIYDQPGPGIAEANFIWLPFFRVYIDGVRGVVLKSPDGRLAVVVPEGRHKVEFVYADSLFYLGLYVVLAFLVLCALPTARRGIEKFFAE